MKSMFYDVESGGLDPKQYDLLSLGIVVGDLDTGEVFETFEAFHKLGSVSDYRASEEALAITKIKLEDCFNKGISTEELRNKLLDLYIQHSCTFVGGHNRCFDDDFIAIQLFGLSDGRDLIRSVLQPFAALDTQETMRYLQGLEKAPKGATLRKTVQALGVELPRKNYHNALYDALASFKIATKFREIFRSYVNEKN